MRGEELDKKNRTLEGVSKTTIAWRFFLFDHSHFLVARNFVLNALNNITRQKQTMSPVKKRII